MNSKITLLTTLLLLAFNANGLNWYDGSKAVTFSLPDGADPVVNVAAGMFSDDMEAVTGKRAVSADADKATIRLYQLDTASEADMQAAKAAGIDTKALLSLTSVFAIKEKEGTIHIA